MKKPFTFFYRTLLFIGFLTVLHHQIQAFQDVPVYLNHFYRVVDSDTYKDIVDSDFLRNEFSTGDLRTTTTSTGDTWSGIYLYGEKNYIEFFNEDFRPITVTGVGFGVETLGGIEQVSERLKDEFQKAPESELIDRSFDGKYIPWFHSTGVFPNYDGKTNLISWVMEYHPGFLEGWYPDKSDASGISRAAVLQHYKAKLLESKVVQNTYFKNVSLLEIYLEPQFLERLLKELRAFGYTINEKEGIYVCQGPDIVFELSESIEDKIGLQRIELTLNKKKTGVKSYRFGAKSVLEFHEDLTASWTF